MDHPDQRPSGRSPGASCNLGMRQRRRESSAGGLGDLSPDQILELLWLEADASAAIAYLFDHSSEWLDPPGPPPVQP